MWHRLAHCMGGTTPRRRWTSNRLSRYGVSYGEACWLVIQHSSLTTPLVVEGEGGRVLLRRARAACHQHGLKLPECELTVGWPREKLEPYLKGIMRNP
jgi:hypothetical protein